MEKEEVELDTEYKEPTEAWVKEVDQDKEDLEEFQKEKVKEAKKISWVLLVFILFLISILIKYDYLLLDSQFYNPHLVQFGAYEILDKDYQNELKIALAKKNIFPTKITYPESVSILQSLTQIS